MGIVLDSSILIAAEKRQLAITDFFSAHSGEKFYLAAISAAELLHGVERANPASRKAARSAIVEHFLQALEVIDYDLAVVVQCELDLPIGADYSSPSRRRKRPAPVGVLGDARGPTRPMITEQQYRRLMKEYQNSGQVGRAALKASVDRKTAARYVALGHGPEMREARWWRTREDPLKAVWPEAERWLERAPELEAKALFEHLLATRPGEIGARSLRTFYQRVAQWKREHGAPREVFFPQAREPGRSIQLDWTHANDLAVRIDGEVFPHLLCHTVLP
jgi:hypothetical protein